ncbi:MAG: asparagine synthase (glutamine-hydrolyzing) [Methylococcaceae bacterium]|nr:asparagine synthase (glutamine-hydrolyzing) [Methylococcaceae bacterium]
MCGIAGILNFDGTPADQGVITAMTDAIAHRGPDSAGHWLKGSVALGHRRLSIIDLSREADQPMISADGRVIIVFNGEIYNYKELARDLEAKGLPCRTHSDTEVIINLYRLYGVDCLKYLRGMFAFAIWDRDRNCLFAARDRVGIKPFYYLLAAKAFVFASEIKAVAVSGYSALNVDLNALAGFIRFLVVPQPDSIFTDIKKLAPGHYLLVTADGSVSEQAYWAPPAPSIDTNAQEELNQIAALDDVLNDSVRFHMVADVPVGAFLSGGLDSSSIVSLMRQQAPGQQIDAFSMTFPGQADYDEDRYAREVARLKDLNYHADTIDENFMDDLERMAWHLDEPFAISSAYATFYLAQNAARKTKVVLTGDGGDELFAGYQGYTNNDYLRHPMTNGLFSAGYLVMGALSTMAGNNNTVFNKLLTGFGRRSGSEGLRYSEQVAQSSLLAASGVFRRDIFLHCLKAWENNLMAHYYDQLSSNDNLQKKLYAEFKTRLVDEMLMKVDRMTMAHSLEARVPLLDHQVVEFAFRLPSAMKLRNSAQGPVTKYILKKSMEKYLPHELIYRRKQGFDIPVKDWFKGEFLQLVGDKVLNGSLCKLGVIDKGGVEKLMHLQSATHHNYNSLLSVLLAFESWLDVYKKRVGNVTIN